MRSILIDSLIDMAKIDENLWLVTADLGYSFVEKFAEKFPDRFLNVGVAEQNMIGVASGLALMGKKVFVYSIINFLTFRCLEQIRNDICYHELDVKLIGIGTGYSYGASGYTHHAIEDVGLMKMLPGLQIFSPFDFYEMKETMNALFFSKTPSYIRISKDRAEEILREEKEEIESLQFLKKGENIALLSYGSTLNICLKTAKLLEEDNISVCVLSMPVLFPEKENILDKLKGIKSLFVIEEQTAGEIALYLLQKISEKKLPIEVFSYHLKNALEFFSGSEDEIREQQELDPNTLAKKITKQLQRI